MYNFSTCHNVFNFIYGDFSSFCHLRFSKPSAAVLLYVGKGSVKPLVLNYCSLVMMFIKICSNSLWNDITIKHLLLLYPFPHKDLKQTTFENFVTKYEIAQNKPFLLLTQCFQLYSISLHLARFSILLFRCFFGYVFKVVCCRFAVWGNPVFYTFL